MDERTLVKKDVKSFTGRQLVLLVLRIDSMLASSQERISTLLFYLVDHLLQAHKGRDGEVRELTWQTSLFKVQQSLTNDFVLYNSRCSSTSHAN